MHRDVKTGSIRSMAGVTLLEAMVTMTIAAILLALGIPGLIDFTRNARRDSQVSDIVVALNYARSEAIRRNHNITVCPSANGLDCNDTRQWETGWIVFTDPNSNGVIDDSDSILRVREGTEGDTTLRGARTRLTYQSTGFSAGFNDTLRVCDLRGTDFSRSVIISSTGRVRVKSKADTCP